MILFLTCFLWMWTPAAPVHASDSVVVWLRIDDTYLRSEPSHEITERALDRRARRGRNAAAMRSVDSRVLDALVQSGIRLRVVSGLARSVSVKTSVQKVDQLRSLPFVSGVHRIAEKRTSHHPVIEPAADPHRPAKTSTEFPDAGLSGDYLEMINALEPIRMGFNGEGIILGFLDTEYGNFQHEVFQSHRADNRVLGETNFTEGPQSNRHGLMVAAVAAGRTDGMMLGPGYGASLIGAVTEYAPTETRTEEENLVAGLEYLEALGADIVNISLGYIDFDDDPGYDVSDLDGETAITTVAVQRATELGVVMVVSAGNAGCASQVSCWYYISTPADAAGAIAVGAVDERHMRASFSSRGPTADGRIKPDVAAPGVRVPVATGTNSYGLGSGTSFSAPLVAGVAAQILQAHPDLRPEDVLRILTSTAHNASSPDNDLGFGIINAGAALEEALRLRDVPLFRSVTLHQPYPNPAFDRVSVDVGVPPTGFTGKLALYDALGRRVMDLHDGTLSPGLHSFTVQTPHISPGVYFFAIHGDGAGHSGSIVLLR